MSGLKSGDLVEITEKPGPIFEVVSTSLSPINRELVSARFWGAPKGASLSGIDLDRVYRFYDFDLFRANPMVVLAISSESRPIRRP